MAWDTVLAGQNSRGAYETGAVTLTHELFHHLGLDHTFGSNPDGQGDSCNDDDRVSDTPVALGGCVGKGLRAKNGYLAHRCGRVRW